MIDLHPPKQWTETRLDAVADIVREIVDPMAIETGTTYVGLENIEGTGDFTGVSKVSNGDLASAKFRFTPEHVLFGKLRPYLRKIARPTFTGVCSTDILPIMPKPGMSRDYLYHYLRHPRVVEEATLRCAGANLPRLSPSQLESFPIVVPFPDDPRRSLAEQKRIAAILDKADAIRRRRQEAARLADTLIPSVFYEMFGDPTFNRNKYPVLPMSEIATKVTDGEHITPLRTSRGIKLLSARNVKNGYIDLTEEVDFVGEEEFERIRQRCDPQQGDVLISCSGTVGRVTTVRITEPFTLVRSVAMVRPNTARILADYLEYYLRTDHAQRLINRSANKSSQANIFLGPIKKLDVMVPPIDLQRRFSAKADRCRERSSEMAGAASLGDDFFNALVQRAFRGEL